LPKLRKKRGNMKAKEIMELVDELIKDSCSLSRFSTFGGGPEKQELINKSGKTRKKLEDFANNYEKLTKNPH
jgi:hypothetical protein